MSSYLLDANVLIALVVREHEHHERAHSWFSTVSRAALTPIVEGSLVRYLVRTGVTASSARQLLDAIYADPRIEFWSDELSFRSIDLRHVIGHRQVTDSYLAALATHHKSALATLDEALHRTLPAATLLVPDPLTSSRTP